MKSRNTICLLATAILAGFAATNTRAADPKSVLNSQDEGFVKKVSQMGMAEVQIGMLGAKKASNADVKAFAEKMVSDHTAVKAEVKTLAGDKRVEISAVTDPNDTEVLKSLEAKATGPDFDKAFLNQMEKDHKKTISLVEDISKDSKDGDLKAWADKTLPSLRSHLEMVKSLQDKQ